jgi:hypothetical protein
MKDFFLLFEREDSKFSKFYKNKHVFLYTFVMIKA